MPEMFRKIVVLTGLWCLTGNGTVPAHDGHHPQKIADPDAHRPSLLPDRIVLTWSGDPTTTQAVTWRTSVEVPSALAEIAVATDGPEFAKLATQVPAKTDSHTTNLGTAHVHAVEFTGLQPATRYAYRVGDGANWSEWFQFRTASSQPEAFSFVYFGDAQNDLKSHWSRVIREAFRDAPQTRFFLHAGDLVNRANNDAEWGEWFQAGGWANGMIPSVPVPGNHEYVRPTLLTRPQLSSHWRPQFTLPLNGPEKLAETVYWFDFQGVRIVALNSNVDVDIQATWLESVLDQNPQRWTIVTFHHPIYSAARQRDNPTLREFWQPILDRHHVDLVLQGHDHTYARSGQLVSENIPTGVSGQAASGTVYVVSVSGPKMYPLGDPIRKEFEKVAEDTQLFQVISVDGAELKYQAKTATGQLYDSFTLRKSPEGKTILTELGGEIPTRRRSAEPAESPAAPGQGK